MKTSEAPREFDDYSQAFAASRAAGAEIIARIGDEICRIFPSGRYEIITLQAQKKGARMNKGDKMEIFTEWVKARPNLLATPTEDLAPMVFIGHAAMEAYRAMLKAMGDLGKMEEQRKATLADAQDAGDLLLDIEAEIGRRYNEARPEQGRRTDREPQHGTVAKSDKQSLTERFGRRRIEEASRLAKNPEAVETIKREARANEDIPSKTAVSKHIQAERFRKASEERKAELDQVKNNIERMAPADVQQYLISLETALLRLPKRPPQDGWDEFTLRRASTLVNAMLKRVDKFLDPEVLAAVDANIERLGIEEAE